MVRGRGHVPPAAGAGGPEEKWRAERERINEKHAQEMENLRLEQEQLERPQGRGSKKRGECGIGPNGGGEDCAQIHALFASAQRHVLSPRLFVCFHRRRAAGKVF